MSELAFEHIRAHYANASIHSDHLPPVQLHISPTPKTCAWCGRIITESYAGGGHGICHTCFTEVIRQAQADGYIDE